MKKVEWHKQYEEYLRNFQIDNAYDLAQKHRPLYIYKYYELSVETRKYIRDVIGKGSICFSDPVNFNDPFDSAWFFDDSKFKSSDKIYLLLKDLNFPFKKQIIVRNNRSLSRCASFTENNDSILMWSHYADEHKGICVGYDVDKLINDRFILMPIVYTDDVLPADSLISKVDNRFGLIYPSLFKARCWAYEHEWRLFDLNVDFMKNNQIEYFLNAIVGIYFGAKNSELKKTYFNISSLLRMKAQKKGIVIKNMMVSKDKFLLDMV